MRKLINEIPLCLILCEAIILKSNMLKEWTGRGAGFRKNRATPRDIASCSMR